MPKIRANQNTSDPAIQLMNKNHTLVDLFSGFQNVPDFSGGSCIGRHELFDSTAYRSTSSGEFNPSDRESTVYAGPGIGFTTRKDARRLAHAVCAECPIMSQCFEWVKALPESERPGGIVAGHMWTRFSAQSRRQKTVRAAQREADALDQPQTLTELIEQLG
jgi:hypothetical protein